MNEELKENQKKDVWIKSYQHKIRNWTIFNLCNCKGQHLKWKFLYRCSTDVSNQSKKSAKMKIEQLKLFRLRRKKEKGMKLIECMIDITPLPVMLKEVHWREEKLYRLEIWITHTQRVWELHEDIWNALAFLHLSDLI